MPRVLPVSLYVMALLALAGDQPSVADSSDDAAESSPTPAPAAEIEWLTDYGKAVTIAKRESKMLFVYFCTPGGADPCNRLFRETLADQQVRAMLGRYVCVRMCLNAKITLGQDETNETNTNRWGGRAESLFLTKALQLWRPMGKR